MQRQVGLSWLAAGAIVFAAGSASAQTEIQFWHAMGGQLGGVTNALAEDFNKSQKEFKVVAVYKGSYTETLTAAIAAFRAKQNPHILQVFEVGTATMMAAKGAVYPVHQLMVDTGEAFDPKVYIGPVYGYYSTSDGKLLSMPFNSSTPVFYWNKEHFLKAGLDPDKAPKTWPEVGEIGKNLVAAGVPCGITVQWQTWTMIENFGAWHNLPFSTRDNGFGGLDTRSSRSTTRRGSSRSRPWPSGARARCSATAVARASRRRCSPAASAPCTSHPPARPAPSRQRSRTSLSASP